jgi:hypothetical protein
MYPKVRSGLLCKYIIVRSFVISYIQQMITILRAVDVVLARKYSKGKVMPRDFLP